MAANRGGGDPSLANILLQPKALDLTKLGDTRAEQEGDALVLSIENLLDKTIYNEDELPVWSRQVNMLNHRGIGLWVTGDNSGVILIFQIPGGDYVIPIDFEGRRYIEIPSAQTAWSDGRWGWRMGSKHASYGQVEWPRIGFGKIPARIKSCIKIEGLTALREFPVPIVNPVIRLGNASVRISGNIESGEYLTYDGGTTATVYNCNWKVLREVPASAGNWIAPVGESKVTVESANPTPPIWIELQALVEGPPLVIEK